MASCCVCSVLSFDDLRRHIRVTDNTSCWIPCRNLSVQMELMESDDPQYSAGSVQKPTGYRSDTATDAVGSDELLFIC